MANFLRNIHPLLKRGRREDEHDNTNFAILNALNHELTQTERDTIQSKIHSSLETATGEYLDKWGDWFGVYRRPGQDDEAYRARIIRYLLLKRGTIPAIIDAIKDFLEDYDATVVIYEPWKNIFYTNKSALNGEDHLMGYYYRFAIIDISIDRPFPPEIREIIQAFKPAGVLFYVNYDGSLNPNNKPWLYPSATATVTSKYVTEFLTGITNNVYGKISMSEKSGEDTDSDYFITNDSDLNGADVLAGSFMHNRSYINLASSTMDKTYTPTVGGTLSEIKLGTTELDDPFYMLTREEDGQFARVNIPGFGNTNLLKDSNNVPMSSNNTVLYPIIPSRVTENGETFLRVKSAPNAKSRDINVYNSIPFSEMTKNIIGKTVTGSYQYRKSASMTRTEAILFASCYHPDAFSPDHRKNLVLRDEWTTAYAVFNIPEGTSPSGGIRLALSCKGTVTDEDYIDFRNWKIEEGIVIPPSVWSPSPEDLPEKALKYYQYYTYDIGTILNKQFKTELEEIAGSTDPAETQTKENYAKLMLNPTISTSMKALVSPVDPLTYEVQIFDFISNTWHTVHTGNLVNKWDKQNVPIQSVIDYLNDNKLLYTRLAFYRKGVPVTLDVDVVNLDFRNKLANKFTITQKMYVYPSVTTVGTLSNVKHNFYSTVITGDYTGSIDQGRLYIDGKYISTGGDFENGKFTYYVRSDLVKRDSIVVMEGWSKTEDIMFNKAPVTLINNTVNFLTNSSYKYSNSLWALTGVTGYTEDDTEFTDSRVLAVQRTGATGGARAFVTHPLRNLPDKTQPLTFSGYYWVDSAVPLDNTGELFIRVSKEGAFISDVLNVTIAKNTPVNKWQYFEITTNSIPDYDNLTCCFALTNNGKVKMRRLKLEQGVNAYPWTPTQTVVLRSDFNTPPKVAGSVLENGNIARIANSSTTLQNPSSNAFVQFGQGSYDKIKKLDNDLVVVNAVLTDKNFVQVLFSFNIISILENNLPTLFAGATTLAQKVQIAKVNISKFQFSIWARGSSPTDLRANHSLFNPISQTWGSATSSTGTSIIQRDIISNNASTPAYLNPDGMYYFNSYATPSDGVTGSSISIDYSRMEITLATPC